MILSPHGSAPVDFQGLHHGAATAPHLPQIFVAFTRVFQCPDGSNASSTKHLIVAVECQHLPRRHRMASSSHFPNADEALRKQAGS